MTNYVQAITTTGSKEDALKVAHALVEARLAGCVQIVGPITSVYRWQGKVEEAGEWQCIIKSRQDLFEALEKAIREVHSYEVPEILAAPVVAGGKDYLAWLDGELGGSGKDRLSGA